MKLNLKNTAVCVVNFDHVDLPLYHILSKTVSSPIKEVSSPSNTANIDVPLAIRLHFLAKKFWPIEKKLKVL